MPVGRVFARSRWDLLVESQRAEPECIGECGAGGSEPESAGPKVTETDQGPQEPSDLATFCFTEGRYGVFSLVGP